jgi:hypothetical protein
MRTGQVQAGYGSGKLTVMNARLMASPRNPAPRDGKGGPPPPARSYRIWKCTTRYKFPKTFLSFPQLYGRIKLFYAAEQYVYSLLLQTLTDGQIRCLSTADLYILI